MRRNLGSSSTRSRRTSRRPLHAPQEAGDVWTWVAIDAESKLIPTWRIGPRDAVHRAHAFFNDGPRRPAQASGCSLPPTGEDCCDAGTGPRRKRRGRRHRRTSRTGRPQRFASAHPHRRAVRVLIGRIRRATSPNHLDACIVDFEPSLPLATDVWRDDRLVRNLAECPGERLLGLGNHDRDVPALRPRSACSSSTASSTESTCFPPGV